MNVATDQPTVKEVLERMDDAWSDFRDTVRATPTELLEGRLGENAWTRKQMLAHISVWHDLASDRLIGFGDTGMPVVHHEDEDVVNARAARTSEGRTTGEVLLGLDESYRRLRREVARLSNDQLAAHDGWAGHMIAGNTSGHYVDHLADLDRRSAGG
jgi:DinB superfamily